MREAFERAILDEPDETVHYAAYADWLQEQGDPRGEFIRVQLALEEAGRAPAEREALRRRERELLDAHEGDWLGDLTIHLHPLDGDDRPHVDYAWRRGFLYSLEAQCLTMAFAHALADEPAARFLRELKVFGEARYYGLEEAGPAPRRVATPDGVPKHWELLELIGAPCLPSLRVFQMGDADGEPPEDGWSDCHTYAPGVEAVVASMPRLEELHLLCKGYDARCLFSLPNLTRLRVLRVYHLDVYEPGGYRESYAYPLDALAGNPALANLRRLLFHPHGYETYGDGQRWFLPLAQVRHLLRSPHLTRLIDLQLRLSDMGDDGARELIDSGVLAHLERLDLRHGRITDAGAAFFAGCPDTPRLRLLDLTRNAVSAAGLASLRAAGINARADNPLTVNEVAEGQYLFEGDGE